ncbi:MAG: hypothetical protein HRU50_08530 [Winogradskyella sp.]|uniref:hypothetical protein n=1 Tax=Winogradskyella sp. TaxID=1883156 RepID=UPI0025EC50D2|nr:hypothetical protein [Winogradskyella sp.]NRB59962.1 hypothetical protein [Winogradskyella sp.]
MKSKSLKSFTLIVASVLYFQCLPDDTTDTPQQADCGLLTSIDAFTYENAATNPYTIISADLTEDCLAVVITAVGCDGLSWDIQLVDSAEVDESNPPQRDIKIFLVNIEACLTQVTRTAFFDVSTLQIENEDEIILNLDGFNQAINYTY